MSATIEHTNTPLPSQPTDTPWPTRQWPRASLPTATQKRIDAIVEPLFDASTAVGRTYGLLIIQRGRILVERYGMGSNAFYLQYSWSMAKSITHALVGIAVGKDMLDIHAPAAVPEWQSGDDPRRHITLDQLLRMSSGLEFREDYVDDSISDVITMLSMDGRIDMGGYAANKPLAQPPGSFWSYSSGTTNIICRVLRDAIGGGATGMLDFMRDELFEPIGMRTPTPRFDNTNTFIGSSFLLATPQDFARFGLLYLRDGIWDGQRILPEGWVDYARRATYNDGVDAYGAHWWLHPSKPMFYASGYDGQRVLLAPENDAMVVRCGRTGEDDAPPLWLALEEIVGSLEG
ncbi:MAG: beta-lactamase family protein [Pseudomonadaceae bacterium]|nr:beta-lactamase family protein [Pseudomonadaceae bacterium]